VGKGGELPPHTFYVKQLVCVCFYFHIWDKDCSIPKLIN